MRVNKKYTESAIFIISAFRQTLKNFTQNRLIAFRPIVVHLHFPFTMIGQPFPPMFDCIFSATLFPNSRWYSFSIMFDHNYRSGLFVEQTPKVTSYSWIINHPYSQQKEEMYSKETERECGCGCVNIRNIFWDPLAVNSHRSKLNYYSVIFYLYFCVAVGRVVLLQSTTLACERQRAHSWRHPDTQTPNGSRSWKIILSGTNIVLAK